MDGWMRCMGGWVFGGWVGGSLAAVGAGSARPAGGALQPVGCAGGGVEPGACQHFCPPVRAWPPASSVPTLGYSPPRPPGAAAPAPQHPLGSCEATQLAAGSRRCSRLLGGRWACSCKALGGKNGGAVAAWGARCRQAGCAASFLSRCAGVPFQAPADSNPQARMYTTSAVFLFPLCAFTCWGLANVSAAALGLLLAACAGRLCYAILCGGAAASECAVGEKRTVSVYPYLDAI